MPANMDLAQLIIVSLALTLVAFLYSSVGHAGASGYIATLTLFGFATGFIKPTALILNIMVACIGSFQFCPAGHTSWTLFLSFALLSVTADFVVGSLTFTHQVYHYFVT